MEVGTSVANPHDALFRFTFSQVRHAADLLRFVLPQPILGAIEWDALQAYPTATADQGLRLHHADLLFQAELRGGRHGTLFFLLEHKSGPDEALLRQLLRYVMHIVTEWQRAWTTVPQVVPVVVHHGRRAFSVAWSAARIGECDAAAAASLRAFEPRLQFLLDDLTLATETEILARPLSAMARLTLLCLRFLAQMSDDAALQALERWGSLITEVETARDGRLCLGALWSYLLHVTDLPADRLAATVARIVSKPNEDFVMSTADKLRAEGRAQGKAEGEAEGEVKGRAEVLLRQLTARFGPLPADVASRVRAASLEALDHWALRILDASSLAEVFAQR
jgi:predicted transposase YdaD